ncbi:hypothetical protein [Pseudomonas zeae]|uniref:hypothetical protein n=1 Tax=Pseudomonas zeae TaxID=2745510 RepID=UPI0039DF90A0
MPIIEIDNAELIERARRDIARISLTRQATHDMQYAELKRVIGWLGALMSEELISNLVFMRLIEEAKVQASDVLGLELDGRPMRIDYAGWNSSISC